MKPVIAVIAECQSNNLGDQAIVRSLSSILDPLYHVVETPFGDLVAPGRESPIVKDVSRKKTTFKLSRVFPAILKARIKWRFFKEQSAFCAHFAKPIQESDLVIVGGGQLIKNNVALFCDKIALISRLARANSKPMVIIGVGVDAKMSGHNWATVRGALEYSEAVVVRDSVSLERIKAVNARVANCSVLPDLVFSLKAPNLVNSSASRKISLAINVMNLKTMINNFKHIDVDIERKFVRFIAGVVADACRQGKVAYLFTTGSSDDLRAANDIRDIIKQDTGNVIPVFHPSDLDCLINFLVDVRDVIATRMHAGILAYISGCNPLCYNWDDKVEGVWSAINQHQRVFDIYDIEHEDASKKILKRLQQSTPDSVESINELSAYVRRKVLDLINNVVEADQKFSSLRL